MAQWSREYGARKKASVANTDQLTQTITNVLQAETPSVHRMSRHRQRKTAE